MRNFCRPLRSKKTSLPSFIFKFSFNMYGYLSEVMLYYSGINKKGCPGRFSCSG